MKLKFLTLLLYFLGVVDSHGFIQSSGKRGVVKHGQGSGAFSSQVQSNTASVKSIRPLKCSDKNYFPLSLLQKITMSEEDTNPIVVEQVDTENPKIKKIKIVQKSYLKTCTEFAFEVTKDPKDNIVVVSVKNIFNFDKILQGKKIKTSSGEIDYNDHVGTLSTAQKYEACLAHFNLLKDNGQGEMELDWPQEDDSYTEALAEAEIEFDPKKPLKMVFGSPKFLGEEYGALNGWSELKTEGVSCFKLEELTPLGDVTLHSNYDAKKSKIVEICNSKDYEKILDILDSNSLGNTPELKSMMLNVFAELSYNDMEEIAEKIINLKIESEEDVEARDTGLRDLAEIYADKVNGLIKHVIEPSISKLDTLLDQRKSTTDQNEIEKIDEQIRKLNEQIAYFSRNEDKFLTPKVLDKLKEHGLKNAALNIADLQLRSLFFGKVYINKKGKDKYSRKDREEKGITLREAAGNVEKHYSSFKAEAQTAEKVYLARTGKANYSSKIESQRLKAENRQAQKLKSTDEYIREQFKYCESRSFWEGPGVKNPSRCGYIIKSHERIRGQAYREVSEIEKYKMRLAKERDFYYNYELQYQRTRGPQETNLFIPDGGESNYGLGGLRYDIYGSGGGGASSFGSLQGGPPAMQPQQYSMLPQAQPQFYQYSQPTGIQPQQYSLMPQGQPQYYQYSQQPGMMGPMPQQQMYYQGYPGYQTYPGWP